MSNPVIHKARAGDLPGAIEAGEALLADRPGDAALRLFVGVLCCRQGELVRGVGHLRQAAAAVPSNPIPRIELARAFLALDDAEAALDVTADADVAHPAGREMLRVRAHALLQARRAGDARDAFARLAAIDAADFEAHSGLGRALLALGEPRAALAPLRCAVRLQPGAIGFWTDLSRTAAILSEWREAKDAALRACALSPADLGAQLALTRALAGLDEIIAACTALTGALALGEPDPDRWAEIGEIQTQLRDFAAAEQAFRRAIDGDPTLVRGWVGLGNVLERLNRHADLAAHINIALAAGVAQSELGLLQARLARSEGRLDDALALARGAPAVSDRAGRAQLIGTLADRLGDYGGAFDAFAEANAAIAAATEGMGDDAEANLSNYAAMRALVTPDWLSRWPAQRRPRVGERRDPIFIFGFPRSGTTLIDTMLGGHPDAVVLEEEGIIQRIASQVGQVERVATLSTDEIEVLRGRYFAEIDARSPTAANRLTIDKEPFGLSSTILLHRLFPDARFVFAERHPCDVVLSCWMTSLRFNHRVGSFHDLVAIARLYDAVLGFWSDCAAGLPIRTTTVRYERLIAAPEPELRGLAAFAGLDWRPTLVDNERNAAVRGYIGSPSYAQVAEPLYTRASGRWTRYRAWIEPILPILRPWITRLGYPEP